MLHINDGFLGLSPMHTVNNINNTLYSGHDSLELYEKNLKYKPIDWYYRDKMINYSYNNLGHRCKPIREINLENYILYIGCSHTEGVGNLLEDTFPYIVSNELQCDYYNLSIGGTGIDTMVYNLNMWLHKIKNPPKYIVWQQPEPTRYLSYDDKTINIHGLWHNTELVQNFIITGDMNNFFNARVKLAQELLKQIHNVIQIDFFTKTNNNIFFEKLDSARDDLHYGMLSNRNVANLLIENIKNHNNKDK
jgi:hypothetical protein